MRHTLFPVRNRDSVKWISGVEGYSVHLSVGGWFFLIFQAGLTAVSILYLLERKKH